MMRPLWRTVWRFLGELGMELPCGPVAPLLGPNLEETKTEKDTCIPLFIGALFATARTWRQLVCPLTDEWMEKSWCICTMEYYSAMKRKVFESLLMRWMNLESIYRVESERDKCCILMHIYRI